MTKWKHVTINITPEEHEILCALAGLKKMSVSAFCRHLINDHVKNNDCLMPYLQKLREYPHGEKRT